MATITVSNASELSAALANYQGETTILLNKGSYGALKYFNVGSKGAVTLKSADPANKAVFEDLQFHNGTGITLDGLAFNPKHSSGEAFGGWGLGFYGSSAVKVVNSTFSGEAGSLATVAGIRAKGSTGVTVENNTFAHLQYGVQVTDSANLKFLDNSLTGIRTDAFQFSDAQGVEIARNFGTNFKSEPYAHPDFVQFFTTNTTQSSENINIHDNVFLQGSGSGVQGVFMGNEAGITYKNVTIANNLFYTSYWNGIAVSKADGVVIDNNTLVNVPHNSGVYEEKPLVTDATWAMVYNVTNAQVTDNIATQIRFESSTGTQSGNVLTAWDGRSGVPSYADVFANANAGAAATIDSFLVKSVYAGKGANLTPLHDAGARTSTTSPAPTPAPSQPALPPASEDPVTTSPAPDLALTTIHGTDARDIIWGTSANELILGGASSDIINAGDGNDIIVGGLGKDWLSGQGGDDIFVYTSIQDSPVGKDRDVISAWGEGLYGRGDDTIDLRQIDANTAASGHQAFKWIGDQAFSGAAGELRSYFDGANTIVEGTVNADKAADFQIQISGKAALTAADFLL